MVEDVELDSGSQGTFRRLVFTRNQNLVQSEAALTSPATSANGDAGAKKKKGGKKGGEPGGGCGERAVDHSLLTSEYHAAMVAGLALVMPLLEAYDGTNELVGNLPHGTEAGHAITQRVLCASTFTCLGPCISVVTINARKSASFADEGSSARSAVNPILCSTSMPWNRGSIPLMG